MSALLTRLETAGVFEPVDVELARALGRMGGEAHDDVLLATALVSRKLRDGHVCTELSELAMQPLADEQGTESGLTCPRLDVWLEQLVSSPLVGRDASAGHPLVLDGAGRLYLARYFDHELRVAAHVLRMANERCDAPSLTEEDVERLFPSQPAGTPDRQRASALASRTRKLSIIVGGPGTGKTSTVARILALLAEDAERRGEPAPRTLLVAPTGKAAQRLSESIARARDRLPISETTRLAIPTAALTIHRALKSTFGSTTRFQHDAHNPLRCDLLLLDEASMVDLALMRRLLDAVPPHARVILLGDPDQLAAVEAGGVLYDLCHAAEQPGSKLSHCLSRLTESYRYARESGIAQLANAVHAQNADEALRVLRASLNDVQFEPAAFEPRKSPLFAEARKGYAGLRQATLDVRLATLDRYRVLCSHRRGPLGVEQLNPQLARAVHGAQRDGAGHYPGRPLLVLQNDYTSSLYNGDVGVLHQSRRGAPLYAYFRGEAGAVRELSVARLPHHESVYAMTVHKSQGSEFDHVAIVLPDTASALVSRELLFTAITRAREGVSVFASEATLRKAIERVALRSSGLSARLCSG